MFLILGQVKTAGGRDGGKKKIVMMQENVARIFKILQCPVPSCSTMGSPSANRNRIVDSLSQLEGGITSRHFVLIISTTSVYM